MAKLIVNNQVVEQHIDPTKPLSIVAQYVAEFYGNGCEFSIELSDSEQQLKDRLQIRSELEKQVADTQSLLGTTSDTTHLLLNELSGFVNKLVAASSLEDVINSAKDIQTAIGDIEGQVATGELTFPYQTKGLASVKQEILERANGVNNLLSD
ncbi:hypothetical protein L1285_17385 [Pseudoalteromonas sp. DL2-H2.2]|uniref:hypothetical protein n=1 Tax=Pseudoalteromonas sp. DL2-H2.2 TaxID=2908889 RepID=UPI001F27CB37|nr:hypothetical protein [Pseudoalteromonas sp. DL2-H2.2]MCF2910090.1 hypothetical protein [Pseudoalteromonas sp. DL2-H2.2]